MSNNIKFGKKSFVKKSTLFAEDKVTPVGARIDFRHGAFIEMRLSDLSDTMYAWLATHGWRQKCGDEGNTAETSEEYYESCKAMNDRILAGNAFERAPTVRVESYADLIDALAELKARPRADMEKVVAELKPEQRAALRTHAQVKAILDRMAAAKVAAANVNVDDLLSSIDAPEAETKPEAPTEPTAPAIESATAEQQ